MLRRPAVLIAVLAIAACQKAEQPATDQAAAPVDTAMVVTDAFRTPESILYDGQLDAYLVSNINGAPAAKDDNGFISRVGTDGRVIELHWIDGASDNVTLHAPKGMGIKGDTLFVADVDEVRLFDRTTGAPLGSRPVRGATFLNDLAVGPDGTVYVTDSGMRPDFTSSGSDALWRFDAGGRPVRVAAGPDLGRPNGIVVDSADVLVVTFGSSAVYRVEATGARTPLPTPPGGGFDGLVRTVDGTLFVSSWNDSSISRLAPGDTAWTRVVTGIVSPADIGLDTRRGRLLIPVFQGDRLEIRPLP
jgi:sugar lactone lactonase YvrE